jgi:hypothetical protein
MRGLGYAQRGVGSIGKGGAATVDTNRYTANEVAHADGQTCPEESKSGEVVGASVQSLGVGDVCHLGGEDDGHDDAVDGDDLAEDDGDEVLGADARRLDTSTDNRGTGSEDTPWMLLETGTRCATGHWTQTYQAEPTTERPMHRAMPMLAQV